MIKLCKISKSFKSREIFKDFSYDFDSKGLYKIVGSNGRGKTTLLKILGGQIPYKGRLSYNKSKLSNTKARKLFSFSLVYHYFILDHIDKTCREIFDLLQSVDEIDYESFVTYLNEFELSFIIDERVDSLSEGEKIRFETVLSLSRRTDVILLDEPLTSLDRRMQKIVKGIITRLSASRLIIYTSHDDLGLAEHETLIDLDVVVDYREIEENSFNPNRNKQEIKPKAFVKNNSYHNEYLRSIAILISCIFGIIVTFVSPTLVDYVQTPSFIDNAIDSSYGYIDYKDDSSRTFRDIINRLKTNKVEYYPAGFIKTFNYNDRSIPYESVYEVDYGFGPMVLSEELFDIELPKSSFFMTSTLYNLIEDSKIFDENGNIKNAIAHIKLGGLSYGGVIESQQLAFVVKTKNITSALNIENIVNEEYFNDTIYDRNGEVYTKPLGYNEAVIYYNPSSGNELETIVRLSLFEHLFDVVGYTTNRVFENRVVISDQIDIFDNYCLKNYPYSGYNSIFPLLDLHDSTPFSDVTFSLKGVVISNYRQYLKQKFEMSLIVSGIALLFTLGYLTLFIVHDYSQNKKIYDQLTLLGHNTIRFRLFNQFFLFIVMCASSAITSIYLILDGIVYKASHLLISLVSILVILILIIINLCQNRKYPMNKSQDIENG